MAVRVSGKALLLVGTLLSFGAALASGAAEAAKPGNKSHPSVSHRSTVSHRGSDAPARTSRTAKGGGRDHASGRPASRQSTAHSKKSADRGAERYAARGRDGTRRESARYETRADRRGKRFAAERAIVRHVSMRKGGKARYEAPAYAAVAPARRYSVPHYNEPTEVPQDYAYNDRVTGLQCVPFARANSGIELTGNAGTWWNSASGVYERGARPEVGSVLNFRSTGRMRMGHVAVVSRIVNPRVIEIDHANWGWSRGRVSRGMRVVDVSDRNDWTAVRVALARTGAFGSVYPTYGFIYDRPDRGTMLANNNSSPMPSVGSARVLQVATRTSASAEDRYEEVAEAPDDEPAPRARRSIVRRHKPVVHHAKRRHRR